MKLPEPVKRFIEDNITLIEQRRWKEFYRRWYDLGYWKGDEDEVLIRDLQGALYYSGVTDVVETIEPRKQVIYEVVDDYIKNLITSPVWQEHPDRINKHSILQLWLTSHLCLSIDVLNDIITEVAIKNGLTPEANGRGYTKKA